jgi:hypothetical protein
MNNIMSVRKYFLISILAVFCYVLDASAQIQSEIQVRREWKVNGLVFSNNFSGARLNELRKIDENRYLAISRPEFQQINPSPFYAFEIESEKSVEIELSIMIDYAYGMNQMKPSETWISTDGGKTYTKVQPNDWKANGIVGTAQLSISSGKISWSLVRYAWRN